MNAQNQAVFFSFLSELRAGKRQVTGDVLKHLDLFDVNCVANALYDAFEEGLKQGHCCAIEAIKQRQAGRE